MKLTKGLDKKIYYNSKSDEQNFVNMYISNIPFVYKPPEIVKEYYQNLITGKIK